MSVRPFCFFSKNLSLHAALLIFSLHSFSFAIASVLRTILFAVCLPGWQFLCLGTRLLMLFLVFLCISACAVAAAFTCLSSSLFTCLACHVQPYELFCLLLWWKSFLSRLSLQLSEVECSLIYLAGIRLSRFPMFRIVPLFFL